MPRTLADTGLPEAFFVALVLRHLYASGEAKAGELAARLCVPLSVLDPVLAFLRTERLAEVPRRGNFDADVSWMLTDGGKLRAHDAMERCRYAGPAPVTLAEYTSRVLAHSARGVRIDRSALRAALGDAVVPDDVLDTIGASINSDRSLFLYGPSGTGKTYLAERLGDGLHGCVWVPHAILVDGEVIQVFDPSVHRVVDEPRAPDSLERSVGVDARWVRTRRPVAILGGELTLDMLELQFDQVSRFYVAPPQVKTNNGMLIVDDLGRQRVAARDLMNRWIVPLSRRVDYLALHTGGKFELPFDVKVVFSSNLSPEALGDPAFARRLGYKVRLDAMDEAAYREVVRQACARAGFAYDETMASHLIGSLHRTARMPLYPTIPYDVIGKLRDRAVFLGVEPVLDAAALDWAWSAYFSSDPVPGDVPTLDDLR